jgi:polar amino acid transport system permease protein
MIKKQRLTREDPGQTLLSVLSERELERIAIRQVQARRRVFIATLSSFLVLGTLTIVIVASPGWQVVKATFFDLSYGHQVLHLVMRGLLTNVELTVIAGIAIIICAMGLALARTSHSAAMAPFRILATVYVDVFRGIPLLLVIFLIGFGVPALRISGVTSNVTVLGTIAVIVTYSAYVAEVLRSGILSVHPSQRAAARSLGLTQSQTLRFVVLPQALKRVIPPLLNDLVALLKDTGLVSILGVTDAIRAAQIEGSRTFNYTPYVVAAILFLLITVPLTRYTDYMLARSIERQNAQGAV